MVPRNFRFWRVGYLVLLVFLTLGNPVSAQLLIRGRVIERVGGGNGIPPRCSIPQPLIVELADSPRAPAMFTVNTDNTGLFEFRVPLGSVVSNSARWYIRVPDYVAQPCTIANPKLSGESKIDAFLELLDEKSAFIKTPSGVAFVLAAETANHEFALLVGLESTALEDAAYRRALAEALSNLPEVSPSRKRFEQLAREATNILEGQPGSLVVNSTNLTTAWNSGERILASVEKREETRVLIDEIQSSMKDDNGYLSPVVIDYIAKQPIVGEEIGRDVVNSKLARQLAWEEIISTEGAKENPSEARLAAGFATTTQGDPKKLFEFFPSESTGPSVTRFNSWMEDPLARQFVVYRYLISQAKRNAPSAVPLLQRNLPSLMLFKAHSVSEKPGPP